MFFLTDTATCGIYTLSLHDAFRSGSADDDRRIEEVGGGVREIWTRRDVLARLESHLPAGIPHRDELRFHLDEIAGVQRREEFDGFVGAEEALIAVVADEQLGADIPEQAEHPGAVHQTTAVMRIVRGEADPQRGLHSVSPSFSPVAGTVASCVP